MSTNLWKHKRIFAKKIKHQLVYAKDTSIKSSPHSPSGCAVPPWELLTEPLSLALFGTYGVKNHTGLFQCADNFRCFYFFSITKMLDISKVKVGRLPKTTRLFEVQDGYFTINEVWTIKMFKHYKPDTQKLSELQSQIDEIEKSLEHSQDKLEISELTSELRKLESQFNYENNEYRCQMYQAEGLTSEADVNKWLEKASNANQNTLYSVAYATWWRSADAEVDDNNYEVLPREWVYTWRKA